MAVINCLRKMRVRRYMSMFCSPCFTVLVHLKFLLLPRYSDFDYLIIFFALNYTLLLLLTTLILLSMSILTRTFTLGSYQVRHHRQCFYSYFTLTLTLLIYTPLDVGQGIVDAAPHQEARDKESDGCR